MDIPPNTYEPSFSADDKLDYIAWHMRVQTESNARIEAMLQSIGQTVTNVDGFCGGVAAALQEMREKPNPMLKMMGMVPPGIVLPGGAQG